MLDFNLHEEVIGDFERDINIKRVVKSINDIGRQVETTTDLTIQGHIRPMNDIQTTALNKLGYSYKQVIKISCAVNADINFDDLVEYDNNTFRVMDIKINPTGNYKKVKAGLL
jgi:hypothetical protein